MVAPDRSVTFTTFVNRPWAFEQTVVVLFAPDNPEDARLPKHDTFDPNFYRTFIGLLILASLAWFVFSIF